MEKVRVGVVTFGSNLNTGPNKMIELGIRDEIGPLVLAISTLSLVPSGGPNVLSAMDEMILMFQRNPRPGVSKLALLIVEGTPTDIQPQDFNKATDAGCFLSSFHSLPLEETNTPQPFYNKAEFVLVTCK